MSKTFARFHISTFTLSRNVGNQIPCDTESGLKTIESSNNDLAKSLAPGTANHNGALDKNYELRKLYFFIIHPFGDRGSTVVKVLRYKSEGRFFDSRWCHWKFSLTQSFRSHYGPGVDSASNRNEYQDYFLGVKKRPVRKADNLATILGHCHVIWEP
jgi:hypothetical protein